MKEIKLYLEGLDCAGCSAKIEEKINRSKGVKEATINFSTKLLIIELKEGSSSEEVVTRAKEIITTLEPHVKVLNKRSSYSEKKECSCGHNHSHNHGHEHSHHEVDGGKIHNKHSFNKIKLLRFGAAVILFILGLILTLDKRYEFIIFLISYLLVGGNIVLTAIRNMIKGQVFDENFLMSIATIGAFVIGEFPEGVAVMIFYQIGELFQEYAVNKSRRSITSLMNIRPDYANLLRDNKEVKIIPEKVKIEDIIIVKPGEKVPLDGVVLEGTAILDTSALTGESLPKDTSIGEEILAGCINKSGVLKIKVTKEFGESTVSKILDLVENAGNKKASTEKFITKFARYYTPIIVISALALAILPPIIITGENFYQWIYRALVFLVVSCPCALVVSIPLGFFGGIGTCSKNGILIKGGNYLEALNNVETVVFDKTGTLTKGIFKVTKVKTFSNLSENKLLEIGAYAEYYSNHPIAKSIVDELKGEINKDIIKDYEEITGRGIKVTINNEKVLAGNLKLMLDNNIQCINDIDEIGTIIHIASNDKYLGYIVISDEVKDDAKETITLLKEHGIKQTIMLTGDNKQVGNTIGKELELDKVYCELLPQNKVEILEKILADKSSKGKVIFVGDGINDAPVLARADIGIAMGGIGSDAAIEAADVVIMNDEPSKIITSLKIAKLTNNIVWQNIIFSFTVKIIILFFGAMGMATMWEAVFGDVGVALIAILNSSRILKKRF